MRAGVGGFLVLALIVLTASIGRTEGAAEVAPAPVTQLTSVDGDCSFLSPQLSGNGEWVAAVSVCPTADGMGQHHQIVRIERSSRQVQVLTPPGGQSLFPGLSADGRRLVFISNADLTPPHNAAGLDQVFLFDASSGRYIQITRIQASAIHRTVDHPRLSGDGETVVFVSNADLVTGENTDGNLELFLYEVEPGVLSQVTHTAPPARHQWPVLSRDGDTLAFLGVHPPFKRPYTGLYVWTRKTREVRRVSEMPAADSGAYTQLVMADQGRRVAFAARFDLLGENPDRNTELFILDLDTAIARQLTHTLGCSSAHPWLAPDGMRLLFVSNCRFGDVNPGRHSNLFAMRVDTKAIVRLTDSGLEAAVEVPVADQAGRVAALSIGAELRGMVNPKRLLQIALVNLPPAEPVADRPPAFVAADELSAVIISRHEEDVLYLASRRAGVLKSYDAGRQWRLMAFGLDSEAVTCLVEHPNRAGLLFAGTAEAGLFRTENSGGLWLPINQGLGDLRILSLAVDPVYPDVLYAHTPSGLYWSLDQGGQWRPLGQPGPRAGQASSARPVSLADAAEGRRGGSATLIPLPGSRGRVAHLAESGLFLIEGDEGEGWAPVDTPAPARWVAVSPAGTWFMGTGERVYRADHPERGWEPATGLPPSLPGPPVFGPGGQVYAAAQGVVYRSDDRGATWAPLVALAGVARLLGREAASGLVVAALDDGGLILSRNGGSDWVPLRVPAPSPEGIQAVLFKTTP